jgi:hypothetical protein
MRRDENCIIHQTSTGYLYIFFSNDKLFKLSDESDRVWDHFDSVDSQLQRAISADKPVTVFGACGPYTSQDSLSYEPLADLLLVMKQSTQTIIETDC